MARNEEKQYGRLNRLLLIKENEEYDKAHPKRPKLDTLDTAKEVQKWLPSIKREIEFYLNKSQVTCYSDAHVEDCREKVVKLEKEFKAFVRKIHQLASSPIDAIPWTNRPYKRKRMDIVEKNSVTEFRLIETPILNNETTESLMKKPKDVRANLMLMDAPLSFSLEHTNLKTDSEQSVTMLTTSSAGLGCLVSQSLSEDILEKRKNNFSYEEKGNGSRTAIVDYDSSDSESS